MSRDVRDIIQRSAPRPEGGPDLGAIARRSQQLRRRDLVVRVTSGVCVLLLAATFGRGLIRSVERTLFAGRDDVGVNAFSPGPDVHVPKTPEVVGVYRHKGDGMSSIPEGRQYVVARGRFDKGRWGDYQGKEWRYLAWGSAAQYCETFEVGDEDGGLGCTSGLPQGHFVSRAYDPGGRNVLSLAYGEVSKDVAVVEFRLSQGRTVRVSSIAAPAPLDVPVNYYVAFLPATHNGDIVALDRDGEVLEKTRLCHDSCLDGPDKVPDHEPRRGPVSSGSRGECTRSVWPTYGDSPAAKWLHATLLELGAPRQSTLPAEAIHDTGTTFEVMADAYEGVATVYINVQAPPDEDSPTDLRPIGHIRRHPFYFREGKPWKSWLVVTPRWQVSVLAYPARGQSSVPWTRNDDAILSWLDAVARRAEISPPPCRS